MVQAIVDRVLGPAMKEHNLLHTRDGQRIKLPIIGKTAIFMYQPFATLLDRVVSEALSKQDRRCKISTKAYKRCHCTQIMNIVRNSAIKLQTHFRMNMERRSLRYFPL